MGGSGRSGAGVDRVVCDGGDDECGDGAQERRRPNESHRRFCSSRTQAVPRRSRAARTSRRTNRRGNRHRTFDRPGQSSLWRSRAAPPHRVSYFCGSHRHRSDSRSLSLAPPVAYPSRIRFPRRRVTPQTQIATQVVIDALVKQYGTLRALNGVSFNIATGEWVALMGPSGSGKTTLINILGGLDTLTSGSVVVDGVDLAKLNENALVRYRAEKIGFVFQQFHLVPYLTALENVMLAQYFHSVTDEKQADEALNRVGLGDRLTHLPAQLSGGEQQRVAIARALINQPRFILAPDPTANSDQPTTPSVIQIF